MKKYISLILKLLKIKRISQTNKYWSVHSISQGETNLKYPSRFQSTDPLYQKIKAAEFISKTN